MSLFGVGRTCIRRDEGQMGAINATLGILVLVFALGCYGIFA